MLTVTLYTRSDCSLCLQAEEDLQELQSLYPHRLVRVDIEEEDLVQYLEKIPVVEVGPYQLSAPFDKKALQMTLGAASDRRDQLEKIQPEEYHQKLKRGRQAGAADRFFYWLSHRYMLVFNLFVFLYLGLTFLAPVLMANGNTRSANVIYSVYGRLCHQLAYRSWFLFGEQPAYPREIAGVEGLITYEDFTGNDPFDNETAFRLRGNDIMGYKIAFCQRDIAIYGAILLFGILFSLTGRKIPSLPIMAWFILGILPIAVDGLSQVVSQLPWDIIPIRESTPFLRTLTGGLFGFATAWFGYPIVEESMADTRKLMSRKIKSAALEGSE